MNIIEWLRENYGWREKSMEWFVVGTIIVVLVVLALGSLGGNEVSPSPTRPVSTQPRVMPNIESESDCGILQAIFDNAENAADGARERGDLGLAGDFVDAMGRADDRMEAVGCYG